MHEMSLCENIIQILEQEANRLAFEHVHCVRLEIGALAGVEIDALRFCFDAITGGTLAEGAQLEIIEQPAMAWCLYCQHHVEIVQRQAPCPRCGAYHLQIPEGDKLRIKDLEVE